MNNLSVLRNEEVEKIDDEKVVSFSIFNNNEDNSLKTFFFTEVKANLQEMLTKHYLSREKHISEDIYSKLVVLVSGNSGKKLTKLIHVDSIWFTKLQQIDNTISNMFMYADLRLSELLKSGLSLVKVLELRVTIEKSDIDEGIVRTPSITPKNVESPVPFTIYAAHAKDRQHIVFYIHCNFDDSLSSFIQCDEYSVKKSLNNLFDIIRDYDSKYQKQEFFPIYFHGKIKKLDFKNIIDALGLEDLNVYGTLGDNLEDLMNMDKTIPSKKGNSEILIRFINTFNHLPYYQEDLTEVLKDMKEIPAFQKEFLESSHYQLFLENINVVMSNPESTSLPPESNVFTKHSRYYKKYDQNRKPDYTSPVSRKQYENCEKIWKSYDLKSVQDYRNLFLKFDVVLLADMFQNYREKCLKAFKIDPCYFEKMSSFSWGAMEKFTNTELEEVDQEMVYLFKTNTEIVPNTRDFPNIGDLVLSQPLPLKDFKWLRASNSLVEKILEEAGESNSDGYSRGYFLEIQLDEYKRKLIHYKKMANDLRNGGTLGKVHRIISFTQSPWAKPFIAQNNNNKDSETTVFHKQIFEMINKTVFKKADEDNRIEFADEWEDNYGQRNARFWGAHSNCVRFEIWIKDFCAFQIREEGPTVKPSYFDFVIPELVKLYMNK